ncbi:MAG: pimeloyl-ACP methyl ester carboxylesterase [Ascidiaceihabitans sp.]
MVLKIIALCVVVALLILTGLTMWKVEQRRAGAAKNYPPEGAFVNIDGHSVHYVDMGAGPDLVLLHGASGNTRDLTFSLAGKLAKNYRVIIFDRPGLGYTPRLARVGVTISDQADLLSKAAQKLGMEKPIVAGQSFGGAVAMAWAVNHPDRISAVVSMAGATYPWEGELDAFNARLAHPVFGPILTRLIAAWASADYVAASIESIFGPQSAPEGYADYIGVPVVLNPKSLMANAQQRHDLRPQLQALYTQYPDLDLPIEIVHGDADTTVGVHVHSTRMVDDIKGANLVVLPGVGHMPQHVSQPEVMAAIDRAATRAGLR